MRHLFAAAIVVTAVGGCLGELDITSGKYQCGEEGKCPSGFSCINGRCAGGDVGPPPECATHEDCVTQKGEYHICRASDKQCVSLYSEECTLVDGDYRSDHAIFIGSLFPTEGELASSGKPMENAIRLALDDFDKHANGLPPRPGEGQRRPLVLIGCNDVEAPLDAARHLAETVQVPAIIGSSFSGVTINVATEVTIPSNVLLLSPSATSVAITNLPDNGLLWRTSPSDTLQAKALELVLPTTEEYVRFVYGLSESDQVKLAILHKGDAYGIGLMNILEKSLVFNNKPALDNGNNYLRFDYGDPVEGNTKYEEAQSKFLSFQPHIAILVGTTEAILQLMKPVEEQWEATLSYRPHYLVTDGLKDDVLWEYVGDDDDLRLRILGTVPGTDNVLFKSLRQQYLSAYGDDTGADSFGVAGAYDALYLMAYAIVAIGDKDVTGPNLAEGFKRLVPPGQQVDVGANEITTAFGVLGQDENADFNGASGPLDFDVETGEAPSEIQIWCIPKDETGTAQAGQHSGLYFDPETQKMEGQFGSLCN